MNEQNLPASGRSKVLHYTGADDDRGGIMSVVRSLAGAELFDCILGVNAGFVQRRTPGLPILELPGIAGESIGLRSLWKARAVARAASAWLHADVGRIFHGHSRAGLLVALWLARTGERRVVASVHCYGQQRWFYRAAAARLGGRLYWLSPAMKRYYGIPAGGDPWAQCIPGCVPRRGSREPVRGQRETPTVKLGGVGAIVRWKRWHLVLEALAALSRELRPRVRFVHIGAAAATTDAGYYTAELRVLTAQHKLGDVVEWRGEQSSSASLLGEIDALVTASDHEPFSIAVLEAWNEGVPVIAADTGGAKDIITPGKNGWLFRSGNAASLAQEIAALVTGDALAHASVTPEMVHPFTAPVVAARWQDVYARLISAPGGSRAFARGVVRT